MVVRPQISLLNHDSVRRFDQDDHDEIVDLTAVTLEEQPEVFPHGVPSKDDGQILHL